MRQLTTRRRAESAPGPSLLEWAARESPVGLIVVGDDGHITAANAAAYQVLSCAEPPVGTSLASLVHADDRPWLGAALEHLSRHGGEGRHEIRVASHSDANPRWLRLQVRASDAPSRAGSLLAVSLEDVSARRFRDEMLSRLADTDRCTGLFNRRRLDEELAIHLERGRRYGARGALLLFDIDDLKGVNDRGGHAAGDKVIMTTAALLRGRVRSSDIVARVGGDEFAVLLFDGAEPEAQAVARDLLAVSTVEVNGEQVPRPSLSVGIAGIDSGCEPDTVHSRADIAMYQAKRAGGERVAVAGALPADL